MFDTDLLEELKNHVLRVRPHGFGITTTEFSKEIGQSTNSARRKLNKLVEEGKLKSEKMIYGGNEQMVYYK